MAITVDFPSQVIDVPQADLTPTADPNIFILQLDPFFKNELRQLEASEEGIVYPTIVNYVPPINIGSVALASVVEIINGYTATFEDGQYAVNFEGANTNLQDNVNVNQVSIRPNNSAGLTYSKQIEDTAFTDARVWIDTVDGLDGVTYPQGTPSSPVRTLADALTIIEQRALPKRLFITGDLIIDQDLINFDVEGASQRLTTLSLTGTSLSRTRFSGVSITGDFAGQLGVCTLERGVSLENVTNFAGSMLDCGLAGTIEFADVPGPGDNRYEILRCYSVIPGDVVPTLDFNNVIDTNINIRDFVGGIRVRELNDVDNLLSIDMDPAFVVLDPTVTEGLIVIRGVGRVDDQSGPNATVITAGVVPGKELFDALGNNFALTAGLYG